MPACNTFRFASLLLLCFSTFAQAKITTLEEARKELKLPNYTAAQRTALAEQAEFFIANMFVHNEIKKLHFGSGVDPLPRLSVLKNSAPYLSNEEFHSNMTAIFHDLHDLHTNYIAPSPLACGAALIPVRFIGVHDQNRPTVIVSAKLTIQGKEITGVSLGDELLSVDGVPIQMALKKLALVSGGANQEAMQARALQLLSYRSGAIHTLPENNSVVFRLKKTNGEEYEKELYWLGQIQEECLAEQTDGNTPHRRKFIWMGIDEYQKNFNKIFAPTRPEPSEKTWFGGDSLREVYEVSLINTPAGKLGYVRIKAFYWENTYLDITTVIDSLRTEIETKLSGATALVVDVRGNPGGYIVFAEKLIQLFSKKSVEPTTVRMLANKINEAIFLKANGASNRWSEAIRLAVESDSQYTSPLAITPPHEANSIGQIWFRPLVVLTDAYCFSACDLFAAGIQDARAGVIIGLHAKTGAGGANVMDYNTFRSVMGSTNNPFKELPYGQNMRVAWRQTIRSGIHQNEILEDAGVSSDILIRLQKTDVTQGEGKVLMTQIRQQIERLAPNYFSGLEIRRGNSILLNNGDSAKWKEKIYGVDSVQFLVQGKEIGTQVINPSETPKEVELSIPSLAGTWTDTNVVLIGKKKRRTNFSCCSRTQVARRLCCDSGTSFKNRL